MKSIRLFGYLLGILAFVAFITDSIVAGLCFGVPAIICVVIGNAARERNTHRRRRAWSSDFSGGSYDYGSYSDSGSSSSSSGCGGGSSSSCGGGGGCGGGS
jgi:hypothetical protein